MNTERGEFTEISPELAEKLKPLVADHIFEVGEVVEIVGKAGKFRVKTFGNKIVTLQVLPF